MTETTEQTRKCSNCMWWRDLRARQDDPGQCRANPPAAYFDTRTNRPQTMFPETHASNWCGSFRMKEPGQ